MISDDPDEDADSLDDDSLLETYLGVDHSTSGLLDRAETEALDWPVGYGPQHRLAIDEQTVTWFKANHGDWRWAINLVLRAWIDARTPERSGS